ncbi:sugar kinase [Pseudooceanicola aestuarii]|uniref:sugar kinase n=1 Tax=Pseudooceanicola aestuarii TaxID=2697319 RepID=UPI0013D77FF6|nr:sugar kinase [Pseudooceanicola aestuarii]
MNSFLGIGECMVELSPTAPGRLDQGFAGDVLNTLWYARAHLPAAREVGFHSGFGSDPLSLGMKAFIGAAGIACDPSPTIAERLPGLYMIHLDGAERSFSYWRDMSAARMLMREADLLWQRVAGAEMVFLSGITLAILPPEDCAALLDGLRRHLRPGARIAFDPNIRPRLWPDHQRMLRVIEQAAALSDIVLPSFEDEHGWFGDPTPEATLRRYHALGAGQVVVKNGAEPTLTLGAQGITRHPVPPVAGLVDTTAAGDSFNGAYLACLLRGAPEAEAVAAAQHCAGQVVSRRGALIPFDQLGQGAATAPGEPAARRDATAPAPRPRPAS